MEGQMSLFDFAAEEEKQQFQITMPNVPEFPREELLAFEKEMLGIYVSGHPLDCLSGNLEKQHNSKDYRFYSR